MPTMLAVPAGFVAAPVAVAAGAGVGAAVAADADAGAAAAAAVVETPAPSQQLPSVPYCVHGLPRWQDLKGGAR